MILMILMILITNNDNNNENHNQNHHHSNSYTPVVDCGAPRGWVLIWPLGVWGKTLGRRVVVGRLGGFRVGWMVVKVVEVWVG